MTEHSDVGLQSLRKEYSKAKLSIENLDNNSLNQFSHWLEEAVSEGMLEPNAMCLATVNSNGVASTRVVLLKYLSVDGLTFFTNYESRKSQDIETNPNVSVNFLWLPLQRQVNIVGIVKKISKAETLKYFLTRPYASQLSAWSSPQSQVISSRSILETNWQTMKNRFEEGSVPLPNQWGGYRIVPATMEFWQGRTNRLHDRFQYKRTESGIWECQRLAP